MTAIFIAILFIWRIITFYFALLANKIFPFTPQFPYSDVLLIPSGLPNWVWAWANFDGVHYITIAKTGYAAQFTQVFFPVYPLVIRILASITGDKYYIISGLTISFISFGFALYIFYKLLLMDYPKDIAIKTLLSLILFPTSFYFLAVYSESLFILLALLCFWFARRQMWWWAGIVGAIASATRVTGILLLPALLVEWYQFMNKASKSPRPKIKLSLNHVSELILIFLKAPVLYLLPLGLVIYMWYLQINFGDWLYFWHSQSVFGAERLGGGVVFPLQVVWRYLKILGTVSILQRNFWVALMEFGALILSARFLLLASRYKIRLSYILFGFLNIFLPMLTGTLSSFPRYILLNFTMYIILGLIKNKIWFILCVMLSIFLQIILLTQFISGSWIA